MAKRLEDIDPTLDPIVRAAMLIEDEEEQPEKEEPEVQDANPEQDTPEEKEEEQPVDGDEVDEPSTEKEAEVEVPEVVEEEPKLTRKEKREAKRQRYLEQIRREGEQTSSRSSLYPKDPNYKPLDYSNAGEVEAEDLVRDREAYARNQASQAAEVERHISEQEKFFQGVEYEARMLSLDPKFTFMDENSDSYDPDRTAELNELYLELVGFNPQTGTVRRTDLSWERFAKAEVARMERWQAINETENVQKLAAQRSTTGIRPSGSPSKSLGTLKPGDISKMSDAEYEKNKAEIDRQILAQLG